MFAVAVAACFRNPLTFHMLATSYHNVNMPKRQTSFNPEWTKEHKFISKSGREAFHGFCTLCRFEVYLCIYFISRSPEILCFQALCTLQDRLISVVSL